MWAEQGTYTFDRERRRDEVYAIDTPPPTVSGTLHVGTVFSYTYTDLAPFLPYATEEVWSWWRDGSVHRAAGRVAAVEWVETATPEPLYEVLLASGATAE